MTEPDPHPIVVAVGHDPIDSALEFAAAEASRLACGLHLVHVVHRVPQGSETLLASEADQERAGRQALKQAVERVRDLVAAEVAVTSELREGGVVPTLVEVVAKARMIVLQHRDLAHLMRVVTRSVSSGVAAHSRVPVVAVPSGWSPLRTHGEVPTVTVGVDNPDRSEQVLRAAAAEAKSRGAMLRVVHAWNIPDPYEDVALSRTDDAKWASRAAVEVQRVLDTLGEEAAGVPLELVARHTDATDALVEASRTSHLLVLGRHDPAIPIGSHLGPVARAVLRDAACPVLLADPRPEPTGQPTGAPQGPPSRSMSRRRASPPHGAAVAQRVATATMRSRTVAKRRGSPPWSPALAPDARRTGAPSRGSGRRTATAGCPRPPRRAPRGALPARSSIASTAHPGERSTPGLLVALNAAGQDSIRGAPSANKGRCREPPGGPRHRLGTGEPSLPTHWEPWHRGGQGDDRLDGGRSAAVCNRSWVCVSGGCCTGARGGTWPRSCRGPRCRRPGWWRGRPWRWLR